MTTPSPSKALSPRASPQVLQYREEVAPGGPSLVDRTSSSKQPGHASVLIEYFERSTAPHSEQKPSIRVQLRSSSPKDPKIMTDHVLTNTSGSRLSSPTNTNELSLRDTSPVFHPALHHFDPEDVSSPPLRQVQSITFPTSRSLLVPSSQLSVDSSVSPVLSTAYQTSGQENVSSPDTSQSYYNCVNRQVDNRSENNISRSTHRSTKFDPDVLDNIISNVIRRLVLPELDSIKQSTSGAAAFASQTASKVLPAADPADVLELNVNHVLPKSVFPSVSEQDVSREVDGPPSQRSDSPMDLSKPHILVDSDLESSVLFHSRENVNNCSHSPFFEPSDEQKESSATILNMDNPAFVPSRNFIEEQISIENDTTTQDPPKGNALATAAEVLEHNDSHLIPSTGKHSVDDIGSDGDAHYFSSEEYPRPTSVVSQSDLDRGSESTQVSTIQYEADDDLTGFSENSLSNPISPILAYHHGRKCSEFSFESGAEGPLNISSCASTHNHSIKHELPPQTTQCPLSESRGSMMSNDIVSVTRNTKISPYGDANMDDINSPLGIHYMIEDSQSYAPWLRRVQDLDQSHVRDMIKDESTTARRSTPIGKRNKTDSSDDHSESSSMIQDNKSRTDGERNGNPRRARNVSPSPKTPSERATVRGEPQTSRNENGTPTKSRIKNDRKANNDSPLSNDFGNQYMAALVTRLLANDLQRNSRDTEILTGVAKLAGEMRMGLEQIRQTIASENQYSRDDINRTIRFEVSKIRGPRPYQPTPKTDSPVGQLQGQKKNLLLRAFGGIKSNSDLERVENLLLQILSQVEHLDNRQVAQIDRSRYSQYITKTSQSSDDAHAGSPLDTIKHSSQATAEGPGLQQEQSPRRSREQRTRRENPTKSMLLSTMQSEQLSSATRKSIVHDSINVQKRRNGRVGVIQGDVAKTSVSPVTPHAYRKMTPLQQSNELRRLENEHQWQNQQQSREQKYHPQMSAQRHLKPQKDPWMFPPAINSESELISTQAGSDTPSKHIAQHYDVPKLRLTTASGHTTTPSQDSSALAAFGRPPSAKYDTESNPKKKQNPWKYMFGRKSKEPEQQESIEGAIRPLLASYPNEYQPHQVSAPMAPRAHSQRQRRAVSSSNGSSHINLTPAVPYQDVLYENQKFGLQDRPTRENMTNSPSSEQSLNTWIDDDVTHNIRTVSAPPTKKPAGPRAQGSRSVSLVYDSQTDGSISDQSRLADRYSVPSDYYDAMTDRESVAGKIAGGAIKIK
ncbi:hypothetical protein V1515DRAFT_473186 [Lipomyces mesembrius]